MTSKHQFAGERVPLGELCRPKQWKSLKQSDMTKSGFPVYGANGIIGHYSEYNHADETILIGCRGTCGEVNVCQPKSYVTSNAMCLDGLSECVDKQFLFCFLKAYDFRKVIGGTSQPQITKSGISSIEVPLFPLEDQRRITLRLLSVLKVIENRRTLLGKLDSLVKSRFVEMFGDPIDGTFWAKRKLSNLYEVKSSKRIYAREQTKDGVPFLRLADIGSLIDSGISDSGLFISEERFEELRSKGLVPNPGDVLVTARGTLGRCYIIKPSDCFYFQDGMITWLAAIESSPLPSYLLAVFNNPHFIEELNRNCSGTTVKYLSISDLANVAIPVPPLELQHEFETFVTQVDKSRFGGMLHLLNSLSGIMHASFFSVADTD